MDAKTIQKIKGSYKYEKDIDMELCEKIAKELLQNPLYVMEYIENWVGKTMAVSDIIDYYLKDTDRGLVGIITCPKKSTDDVDVIKILSTKNYYSEKCDRLSFEAIIKPKLPLRRSKRNALKQ